MIKPSIRLFSIPNMIPHFLPLLEIIEQNHALVAFSDTRNIFKKKQILPLEVCFRLIVYIDNTTPVRTCKML
jgi:phosphoribosylaminoimidazole-succinocarboxamide synthase